MIYITGDMHRDFKRLMEFDYDYHDMLIILGDTCINYYLDERDHKVKRMLNNFGIKLFCIRGNHEERPENISTYKEIEMFGGKVFMEDEFPNLIFAKDGEIYDIDGNKTLVIGGAYSVDKDFRLRYGYEWFKDEQLTKKEMESILKKVQGKHFDIILTHTCPYDYEPTEMFLGGINQKRVDKSMEHFLNIIEENINYDKWYCGHYHTDKKASKLRFMYNEIEEFSKEFQEEKIIKKVD